MEKAYKEACKHAKTLGNAFTIGMNMSVTGVDSNTFTPWVRLSVEYLDDVEFSFYQETPHSVRQAIIDKARLVAEKHGFGFDLIFPTQEPIRISSVKKQ